MVKLIQERGHLIVDQALSSMLIKETSANLDTENEYFEGVYNCLLNKSITITEVESNEMLRTLSSNIDSTKQSLIKESRTAKLWIGYQRIIDIIKKFIEADRIAKWNLHLEALQESLVIFAASGHGNYTKSAYLYLQSMLKLERTNKSVFEHFKDGGFIVRRSNRYWTGLPNDLIIEQVNAIFKNNRRFNTWCWNDGCSKIHLATFQTYIFQL